MERATHIDKDGWYINGANVATVPKDPSYPLYGGRGIKVCNEWTGPDGHENFYRWAIEQGEDWQQHYEACAVRS